MELSVRLDSAGTFRVSVPPGRYYARFSFSSDTAPAPVLVVPGAADTVRIRITPLQLCLQWLTN